MNVDDPASMYYRRPDLIAAAEANLKAAMLRAGVNEAPETPADLAHRLHDAAFPHADSLPPRWPNS